MPVDIGGIIVYGAVYLTGLLVLAIAAMAHRNKATLLLLLAYLSVPLLVIAEFEFSRRMHLRKVAQGEAKNLKAFETYCKERRQFVHKRVAPVTDTSLLVRLEKGFTGINWKFSAFPIYDYMNENPAICEKAGLSYLEGIYDGRYVENKGYEHEVRLYKMCSRERKWSVKTEAKSRYELILGESNETKAAPWGNEGGARSSRSSVRLVDRQTGATLAEDTLYFLSNQTGVGECPNGMEQIASLISEVFLKE